MTKEAVFILTIDGSAGSGKSTTARQTAQQLNFLHVDTGVHFRALAYYFLNKQVASDDVEAVRRELEQLALTASIEGNKAVFIINGQGVADNFLRSEVINNQVSLFASIPELREILLNFQRSLVQVAQANGFKGIIFEGRDMGSVVFPDADLKIFLEADEAVRQARRNLDGYSDAVAKRDALDVNRKTAPMRCPEGAQVINTGELSLDAVVEKIKNWVGH